MVVISSATIAFGISSGRYFKALDTVRRRTTNAFRRIGRSANPAIDGFSRLSIAIANIVVGSFVRNTLRLTDSLSKLARSTSFNFENLQRLQFGFERAGISTQTFRRAVGRLGRVVEDAQAGLTTYERNLRLIGLQTSDIVGLNLDEAFLRIVEAISLTESSTARLSATTTLLGRNFLVLPGTYRNVIRDGAGIVAITDRQASVVETFNDAITRSTFNLRTNVVVGLEPFLAIMTVLIERFNDLILITPNWVVILGTLTVGFLLLSSAVLVVGQAVALTITRLIRFTRAAERARSIWGAFRTILGLFPRTINLITTSFVALRGVLASGIIAASIRNLTAAMISFLVVNAPLVVITGTLLALAALFPVVGQAFLMFGSQLASAFNFNNILQTIINPLGALRDALRDTFNIEDLFSVDLNNITFIDRLTNVISDAFKNTFDRIRDTYNRLVDDLTGAPDDRDIRRRLDIDPPEGATPVGLGPFREFGPLEPTSRQIELARLFNENVERAINATENLRSSFSEGFTDFINTGDFEESFKGVAESFAGSLNDAVADNLFNLFDQEVMNLFNSVFDDLTSVFSDIIEGFESVASQLAEVAAELISAGIDIVSGLFSGNIPFFAEGGRLGAGRVGIVGEAGPELITGPANITPLDDASFGNNVNITLNVTGNVDEATRRAVLDMGREITNIVQEELTERRVI